MAKKGRAAPGRISTARKALKDSRRLSGGILRDAKRLKDTEKKLLESEREKKAILDSLSELVIYLDMDFRTMWANRSAKKAARPLSRKLVGRKCYEVWGRRKSPCPGCPVKKAFRTGKPEQAEIGTPDGRVWSIRGNPVRGKGKIIGAVEIIDEITKKKEADKALKESEEKLSTMIKKSPIPTAIGGSDGSIISFNEALERLIGYRQSEIKNVREWSRKLYPDRKYRESVERNIKQALAGKRQECSVFNVTCKDGSTKTIEFHTSFFSEGLIIQMVDVTEKKGAEKRLKESEEKWRSLTENVPSILFATDRKGRITFINRTVSGFSVDKVIGKSIYDYINPEYHGKVKKAMKSVLETGKPESYENLASGPHGEDRWYSTTISPLMRGGKRVGIVQIATDITGRKKAEKIIRESEERHKSILDGANDGVLVADVRTRKFVFANPRICEMTGYPIKELMSMNVGMIHPKKDVARIGRIFRKQIKGEIGMARDLPVLRKDGKIIYCDINSKLVEINDRDCLVGFFRDITDKKKSDEELRKRTEELERFNRLAVGRELKMMELKKKVKELESRLDGKGK